MQLIRGKFTAKHDARDALVALATGMYAPSRAENGCVSYGCYEEFGSRDVFMFFEEWTSQEAIDAHFSTAHFHDFMARFPAMIDGAADIRIYTASSDEGAAPAEPPDGLLVVVGKLSAKAERRADLIALSQGMFASSRAEDGCISYNFYEAVEGGGAFLFFEEWRDRAALDRHFATAGFRAFAAAVAPMLEGAPAIRAYAVSTFRAAG